MFPFFGRKELYVTFSIQQQAALRTLLQDAKIPYRVRVVDRRAPLLGGSSRARTGTFGEDRALQCEYIFYVPKKKFSQAEPLLLKL